MSPPLLFDCDLPNSSPSSLDQQPPPAVATQKRRRAGASAGAYSQQPSPTATASVVHHNSNSNTSNNSKPLIRGISSPVRRLSSSSFTSATTAASSTSGPLTPPRGEDHEYYYDVVDLEAPSVPLLSVSVGGAASAAAPAVVVATAPLPRVRGRTRQLLRSLASHQQAWKLAFGASGVYACYLAYGHLQEDIYRFESPLDGSKFQAVWYLQVLECACNVVVGLVGRRLCGGTRPTNTALRGFAHSGASQVLAKVLTSLSLAAGLSFPVCVLAKSAKIVPVMVGQLVLGGSQYRAFDAVWAGAVVLGTTLLSLGGNSHKGGASQQLSTPAGLAFILLSLVMDGITAGLQKRLKKDTEGRPPTTYDFLLFTNAAMGIVALVVALALGDLSKGSLFLAAHPVVQQMVVLSCLLSALGQSFVFYVVAHFDPMVCATVTTTRKILSVVWSIATKGHSVAPTGAAGLALAIGGVLLGLVGGEGGPSSPVSKAKAALSPPNQSSSHPRRGTVASKQRMKVPRSPEPDVVVVAVEGRR